MNETIRLYDADAYRTEFTGTVLSCTEKKGNYELLLDQTLFFPEEGGQSPDKGILGDSEVLDVRIRKGLIYHTVGRPYAEGEVLRGTIDWNHRFSNMQNHSGEHILTGTIHNRFGYDNVGFHLSDQTVTIDINGTMTEEEIRECELAANHIVAADLETVIEFPSKEELAQRIYRSKIEIEGQVRLVTFPGVDTCACCAPHVRRTGEIGIIRVLHAQNYKGGMRLTILSGFRALQDAVLKQAIVSTASVALSAKPEAIPEAIERLKKELVDTRVALNRMTEKEIERIAAEIPAGRASILRFTDAMDNNLQRKLVNLLLEKTKGLCGVFAGDDESGYRYIIASTTADCRELAGILRTHGGRGGGSAQMVQGSIVMSEAELTALLAEVSHE